MSLDARIAWWVLLSTRAGTLDALRALTRRMTAAAGKEPGTLVYERFVSETTGQVLLHERYESSEAALQHLRAFDREFAVEFSTLVQRERFLVFGRPSAALRERLDIYAPQYYLPMGKDRP